MIVDDNFSAEVRSIGVGGAAGDGVREAGIHFAQFVHKLGFNTYIDIAYPSLIRGGHNFATLSYSGEDIASDYPTLDILLAVNEESVRLHLGSLKKDAIIFVESAYADSVRALWPNSVALPMSQFAEEEHAPHVARTSVALGAFGYLVGMSAEQTHDLAVFAFRDIGGGANIRLAERGYQYAVELQIAQRPDLIQGEKEERGEIVDGNKAVGKGLLAAGLEYYVAYPMTPATSILHFLAKVGSTHEKKIHTIQPEDEIAVMNMSVGIAYAGKRVACGSATGGFALMQEAFSLAGVAEAPIVVVVSQRQGPATGVATHTSQGDLQFVLHSGHGEFPRIVFAPGDSEEAFYFAAQALNFAWKFQVPVIVLLDKRLSENMQTAPLDAKHIIPEKGVMAIEVSESYKRYAITESGVSPMAFPGTPGTIVKGTSYEHHEGGTSTDDALAVKAMSDKRFRKYAGIRDSLSREETVKVYGDPNSETVVICWGSTKGPVLEALKNLSRTVKVVQIICMEPFDTDRVMKELSNAKIIIDVEANHNAQLAALIREKTGIQVTHKILRYDAQTFNPIALAQELNAILA